MYAKKTTLKFILKAVGELIPINETKLILETE